MTDILDDQPIGSNELRETTPNAPLQTLFMQFEERYRRESSDVRAISCQMQEIVNVTEGILDDLEPGSLWRRFWRRITGHTRRANYQNYRNQLKLQQSGILLVAAIARQNRMVMEGLKLTLEKLHNVEQDARFLRDTVLRIEQKKERRKQRWRPVTRRISSGWQWFRQKAARLFKKPE